MTEQLPAGRRIYPDVAAMNTPAELSATFPSGHLAGLAPRSLVRRYAGLARKAVQRHQDRCLVGTGGRGGKL